MERDADQKKGSKASSSEAVGREKQRKASSSEAVGREKQSNASSSEAVGREKQRKASSKVRPYERPRGGAAKPISELMPQIGRTAFRRFGFVQSSVVTRWPEIVGETHAMVCSPEAIRFPPGEKSEGILQLVVTPAHAPLIQHIIPEIIERVNRFFGYNAVSRVKIRQGAVKKPSAEKPKAPPSLMPIPMELGDSLRDIGDPELRTVLESLARSLGGKEDEKE
ncbi:DUF721 domain-containing protein [Erythrobacter sp. HKB08]|uniref:DUF721 domain-containing protein n=1 Tax=Erythrobacter sp. HKB08 TaxID=2502843 RepID=UPI001008BCDE|nr:DciA family protein [Erythrobacter sp. HKB08]